MRKLILISIFSLLITFSISSQEKGEYKEFKNKAWSHYLAKEYQKSADSYKAAFDTKDGKANFQDRYNAACSYALAGDMETSFFHLFRLANGKSKYSNLGHITTDSDLDVLHANQQWNKLIDIVKLNKEKAEINFDKPLVAQLDSIRIEDQKYRRQIRQIDKEFGWNSDEMKAHWKIIHKKDSINLIAVKKILKDRGWLGKDIIGKPGNTTLFLVIQHADHATQLEYLPVMRDAVKKGNARGSSLALLEDRVALKNGDRQIYGSQIHTDQETREKYVAPLIDPENVDKRRAEVGLGPLADYITNWDMKWDLEKHKMRSAKIKKEQEAKLKSPEK